MVRLQCGCGLQPLRTLFGIQWRRLGHTGIASNSNSTAAVVLAGNSLAMRGGDREVAEAEDAQLQRTDFFRVAQRLVHADRRGRQEVTASPSRPRHVLLFGRRSSSPPSLPSRTRLRDRASSRPRPESRIPRDRPRLARRPRVGRSFPKNDRRLLSTSISSHAAVYVSTVSPGLRSASSQRSSRATCPSVSLGTATRRSVVCPPVLVVTSIPSGCRFARISVSEPSSMVRSLAKTILRRLQCVGGGRVHLHFRLQAKELDAELGFIRQQRNRLALVLADAQLLNEPPHLLPRKVHSVRLPDLVPLRSTRANSLRVPSANGLRRACSPAHGKWPPAVIKTIVSPRIRTAIRRTRSGSFLCSQGRGRTVGRNRSSRG